MNKSSLVYKMANGLRFILYYNIYWVNYMYELFLIKIFKMSLAVDNNAMSTYRNEETNQSDFPWVPKYKTLRNANDW